MIERVLLSSLGYFVAAMLQQIDTQLSRSERLHWSPNTFGGISYTQEDYSNGYARVHVKPGSWSDSSYIQLMLKHNPEGIQEWTLESGELYRSEYPDAISFHLEEISTGIFCIVSNNEWLVAKALNETAAALVTG